MKKRLIALRAKATDIATQMSGSVTHWTMNMDQQVKYLFQPEGTDPETGQPLRKIYLEGARLKVADDGFEEVDIPFDILGTQATDTASGFEGMVTEFVMHTNGCFHIMIQPSGLLEKTALPTKACEFDLRSCVGEKIPKLSEEEHKADTVKKPSPVGGARDAIEDSEPVH